MESARIQEIQQRVRDFAKALRAAEAPQIAERMEAYAAGFTDVTQVRRSVASIQQQLEYWRAYPQELPDLPIVHIAANRLEDVCKDALRSGVIVAARPSLRAQSKRKLAIIITALAAGGLMFFAPLAITMLGIDLTDVHLKREVGQLVLQQGEEAHVAVTVLVASKEPALTRGVELYPRDHCKRPLPGGAQCKAVDPRHWADGKLPTFELMLPNQAYGLLFAASDEQVSGSVGGATILLAATEETPEGHYEIALAGAFLGYRPERCSLLERVQGKCQPRSVGADARDDELPVPVVVVDVVHGDLTRMAGEKRRKQAEAEEKKRQAEQRAAQISAAITQIKSVMDDTHKTLKRKRYEQARARIDKLTQLFAPLDVLVVIDAQADVLPTDVEQLRARFEEERSLLRAFEDRAFDQAYKVLTAATNKKREEAALLSEVAANLHISREYMETIYTAHADELEKRMNQVEQDRLAKQRAAKAALEQRCGPLPTATWKTVETYLKGLYPRYRIKLDECLTPRLTEARCWVVTCAFKIVVPTSESEPDQVSSYKWSFLWQKERVAGHVEQSLEAP